VDPVAELGAEHVVNKLVLGDAAEARERGAFDDRLEVSSVAGDIGARSRDRGFDAILQLVRGYRHVSKRSESGSVAILNEA
jgi:hypothetical protein